MNRTLQNDWTLRHDLVPPACCEALALFGRPAQLLARTIFPLHVGRQVPQICIPGTSTEVVLKRSLQCRDPTRSRALPGSYIRRGLSRLRDKK